MTLERTGIYGGTFNPIHLGHLRAARSVADQLGLARVVFIPSGRPPHKHADDPDDPIADPNLRLSWVREAIADEPRFEASSLEVERDGPSYLVDTLAALRSERAGERLVFLLGRDAFEDLGNWREPRRLLTLADFAVTTRPPETEGDLRDWLPESVRGDIECAADGKVAFHREAGTRIELVDIRALDVSATAVRAHVRAGRPLEGLVPERIREKIERSGVYTDRGSATEPVK